MKLAFSILWGAYEANSLISFKRRYSNFVGATATVI